MTVLVTRSLVTSQSEVMYLRGFAGRGFEGKTGVDEGGERVTSLLSLLVHVYLLSRRGSSAQFCLVPS